MPVEPPPHEGLRATNKERTRAALSDAAVAIVAAEGIDALTADRIAAEAGVSRRTLFNYFATVEDVLTSSIEQVTRDTVAAFVSRPGPEPLRESVMAVLEELIDNPVFAQAFTLELAARESRATRRFLREFTDTQIGAFETALHQRLGEGADPVFVSSLAAATGAVLSRMTRLVVEQDPGADPADPDVVRRQHDTLRRALALMFAGFEESGAQPPAQES